MVFIDNLLGDELEVCDNEDIKYGQPIYVSVNTNHCVGLTRKQALDMIDEVIRVLELPIYEYTKVWRD